VILASGEPGAQRRSTTVCSDEQLRARRLRRAGADLSSALEAKMRTPSDGSSASAPLK
jgi:hypothetical protein